METLIAPLGSYARLIISRNSTELYSERCAAIQQETKSPVAADIAQRTEQNDATGRPPSSSTTY